MCKRKFMTNSPPVFSGAIPNIWSFEPDPLTTAVMSSEERSTSFPHAEMSGRPSRHRRTPKHLEEYLLDYSHHRPALSSPPTAEVPVEQRGAAAAVGIFSQSRPDSSQGEHPATSSTDLLSMSSLRELMKSISEKERDEAADMAALQSKLKQYEKRQHRRQELMKHITSFLMEEGEEEFCPYDDAGTAFQPQVQPQLVAPTPTYQHPGVPYICTTVASSPRQPVAAPPAFSFSVPHYATRPPLASVPQTLHSASVPAMSIPTLADTSLHPSTLQPLKRPEYLVPHRPLHAAPQPKIPDFVNDNEREFANLKLALDNLLEPHAELDEKYKYHILLEHLKLPEAQMIGQSCRHHPYPYSAAMQALQLQYGQPHQLAQSEIAAILTAPEVKPNDARSFQSFALRVHLLVSMLLSLEGPRGMELNCCSHVDRLVGKLPKYLRDGFIEFLQLQGKLNSLSINPYNLQDFAGWLHVKAQQQRLSSRLVQRYQYERDPSGSREKSASKPRSQSTALYHGAAAMEDTASPGSKVSWKKTPLKVNCLFCGSRVLLKVVPVLLHHEAKTIETYAILDDGAQRTMILPTAVQQLQLKGEPETLALRTVRPDTTHLNGSKVTFEISARGKPEKRYQVFGAFTASGIDLVEQSYPVQTLQRRYAHLRGVPLQPFHKSPLDRAQSAKNKGNKYFKAGKYEQAIQCYTEAISLCPKEQKGDLSTFYQNRAAAYEQQMKWTEVIQDCSQAVELNPCYVKALFRRAKALEKLDKKRECLEDVTAVCILEVFQNQQSMLLADKVLKQLGREKAKEKYKNREPLMPSPQFIKSYFSSFTDDIISQPLQKGEKKDEDKDKEGEASEVTGSSGYLKAKQYMEEENYDKIISECTKEIESGGRYTAEALLLRATFYLLIGNATAAQPDLDRVINMEDASVKLRANALIKRGSMYMQQQQPQHSTQDFNMAAEIDPRNADVYHHRGQLKILLDQVEEAVGDFDECIKLRPDSALAQAQKCFALYRQAYTGNNPSQVQKAMDGFEDVIRRFPKCAEGYALYAQALTDQQQFGKADEMYDKCIELEPDNATTYVHKGLLQLQWKQDLEMGLELISKAIEIDNKCDFAYETMGTIEVQRGNLDKAIDMFNKAINLAKSEMEMAHLYSLCDAAYAQTEVAKKYGLKPPTL
ncbi:mitochondrial import receptor subunit TOM70 [Pimephales promelas]|nr:mitochondrial import receptor subunit TOM70 [Pimephales promelas]